LFGAARY